LADVVAGWIMIVILQARGMSVGRSLKYSSLWLLNPMVYKLFYFSLTVLRLLLFPHVEMLKPFLVY
jgi:hypothetical protein